MKVLEIGGQPLPKAQVIWPDAAVEHMNIDKDFEPDHLCDAANPPEKLNEQFDAVFASHILEHVPYFQAGPVIGKWKNLLKTGGELHVIVPSLEWAARQALSPKPSPAMLPHLFAGLTTPYDVHNVMFTMPFLRQLFQLNGFHVKRARTGPYVIMVNDVEYEADQHYVMGEKQ